MNQHSYLARSVLHVYEFAFPCIYVSMSNRGFRQWFQDSYALCRVFNKNGACTEIEEQGHCSSQGIANDIDTMSPELPMGSSSCVDEDDDKDDSWMQFIREDAWCSSNVSTGSGDDSSCIGLTNWSLLWMDTTWSRVHIRNSYINWLREGAVLQKFAKSHNFICGLHLENVALQRLWWFLRKDSYRDFEGQVWPFNLDG